MTRSALAIVLLGACSGDESGACEGYADRNLGITGTEYRSCAGEILAELDEVRPRLESLVAGERTAATEARRHYDALRDRIDATGIMDDYRSMRSSTVVVKWPESSTRDFNSAALDATVRYGAVLAFPNDDNLQQGIRAHEEARLAYERMR